ncbi:MAG: hypothetical protein KAH48_05755, partial [Chlorobi bacterium]|nr:hypothetical protein [Chlorobiota bacterium]
NSWGTIIRMFSPIAIVIVSALFVILYLLIILVPENMLIIKIGGEYDFIEVLPYLIVLSIGLFFAWTAPKLGLFPRKNAILIVVGMTCFFLCDVNVGLSSTLYEPMFFNNIAWIFYIPALLCLGLSGRNLEEAVA